MGRYTVLERAGHQEGAFLRDVVPTLRVPASAAALALTPGQQAWISARLGGFPLEGYGILVADTDDPQAFDFTGLETQTLTLYKPAYLTQPEDKIAGHMVHELAHSWFGNSVTPADWSALWLNEGHAELYGLHVPLQPRLAGPQGLHQPRRPHALDLRPGGHLARDAPARSPVPPPRPCSTTSATPAAPSSLYALRERVGEEAFIRIERDFLTRFRHGNAGTEDFIDVAVQVSQDTAVRPFLRDWLYGTTTPRCRTTRTGRRRPPPTPDPTRTAHPPPQLHTDRQE